MNILTYAETLKHFKTSKPYLDRVFEDLQVMPVRQTGKTRMYDIDTLPAGQIHAELRALRHKALSESASKRRHTPQKVMPPLTVAWITRIDTLERQLAGVLAWLKDEFNIDEDQLNAMRLK